MRALSLVVAFLCVGCGSVSVKPDAGKDGATVDTSVDSAPTCGLAGQTCCASNKCDTNLKCTPLDQVCRTAEVFFGAADINGTSGVATIGRGDGVNFTLENIGTGAPTAIWGTSATDVWVIVQGPNTSGNAQTSWARHWDGSAWGPQMNFPDGNIVYALWGDAPNNYWAVNNGGSVLHWNGQTWALMNIAGSLSFAQIWGSSSTDVYALAGSVYHMDSSGTWSPVNGITGWGGTTLRAVSGHANGDFISGGFDNTPQNNPSVLRHSGSQYTVETLGTAGDCAETFGVWDGPDDEWAITASAFQAGACNAKPTFVHYTGGSWTSAGLIPDAGFVSALWGTSNKDLYTFGTNAAGKAAVLHYNGIAWTTSYTTTAVTSIRTLWGIGGLP